MSQLQLQRATGRFDHGLTTTAYLHDAQLLCACLCFGSPYGLMLQVCRHHVTIDAV